MTHENRPFHAIKDPVHGTMQFSSLENSWIKPFIDSPLFQRLRHIKQMGMGDLIFPGSVHTRFSHCIGCCYVASQIVQKIGLTESDHQLVLLACLLHDIGHGPFSHVFEDLFHQKSIHHEEWTPYLLETFRSKEFFESYNSKNPNHPLTENKFDQICRMIMHNSPDNPLLADIVSSQLDADRLDYLLRDNHFCGVSYGAYDLSWMLNTMIAIKTTNGYRLGITQKGIGVVEHYLMARRLMTKNIYHHRKKLALEFFLIELLAALAKSLKPGQSNYFAEFDHIRMTPIGKFLQSVNSFNIAATEPNADIPLLKQEFLKTKHTSYSQLCDYDIFALLGVLANISKKHTATRLAKRILHRVMPDIIDIDTNTKNITNIQKLLAKFHAENNDKIEKWQLALIQSPHYSYERKSDPILVKDNNQTNNPLEKISPLIEDISRHTEQTVFLCVDSKISTWTEVSKFICKVK